MASSITLRACGGLGPFTWSKTGNVTLSSTTGTQIKVSTVGGGGSNSWGGTEAACMNVILHTTRTHSTPDDCSSNGSTGTRQSISADRTNGGAATCTDCNGDSTPCPSVVLNNIQFTLHYTNCTTGVFPTTLQGGSISVNGHDDSAGNNPTLVVELLAFSGVPGTPLTLLSYSDVPSGTVNVPTTIDIRSSAMIVGGCPACECDDPSGATVTVTDAAGVSVTYIV